MSSRQNGWVERNGEREDHYRFRLYIAGPTTTSTRALVNLRKICEEHLKGRYDLEVLDVSVDPSLAEKDQIIALPTLVKLLPDPERRFIGDMSNTARLLSGLGIGSMPAEQ